MATCTDFIEPLNLECILVNIFAESHLIFIFASYLFIAIIAAYFKMNGFLLVSLIFLFSIVMKTFIAIDYILIIIAIIVSMVTFASLSKLVKN